ncbi:MAG TPA: hypothetical protein VGG31_09215 [Candidatus Dormibacteraeota bacterium]|jgi:hypothetical protein
MHTWGFESEAQALDEQEKRFAESRENDRAGAQTFGQPAVQSMRTLWRSWLLVGLVAVFSVMWFLGRNTPSLIAGAVTAGVALGLAIRLLRLRRS